MGKTGLSARRRGHAFERDIVNILKELGYNATTSRYSSRELDDAKVDIDTDFPFHIQAKYVERMSVPVHDLLKSMPDDKPCAVLHKRSNKGVVVSLTLEDFLRTFKNAK